MDPESLPFLPREDIWRFHTDMLRIQQTQVGHEERLSRVERRLDEEARAKSVWGSSSPFPSVLCGTPQQSISRQTPVDSFNSFDYLINHQMGSIRAEENGEEPRRHGTTSRPNSVRFDDSANQGHRSHASRSSLDLIPRVEGGLDGQAMTVRSYSHKSDGRQSSAGQSTYSATSGRANSMDLEINYDVGRTNASMEPPYLTPGLFILGSVPSIIRCWLNESFKNDTLLYAAVCSGSYTSFLDISLVKRLDLQDRITADEEKNVRKIMLPIYFPEAVRDPKFSLSSSHIPQLPSLTVNFTVVNQKGDDPEVKPIQVFLGSDILRTHMADILFSSNVLTIFDYDRRKLSIPLVRPENDRIFKSLYVASGSPQRCSSDIPSKIVNNSILNNCSEKEQFLPTPSPKISSESMTLTRGARSRTVTGIGLGNFLSSSISPSADASAPRGHSRLPNRSVVTTNINNTDHTNVPVSATGSASSSPAIWSNWRRDADKSSSIDSDSACKTQTTNQHRENGAKILKWGKTNISAINSRPMSIQAWHRSSSGTGQNSRFFDDGKRKVTECVEQSHSKSASERDHGSTIKDNSTSGISNTANPVGEGSAFAWLNSREGK